jgi:uncharacterized protein YbgA (DUF1722 family)/uncharacterized protein YbbK (DUF523 family)
MSRTRLTSATSQPAPGALRLGISACLLGQNVRYDGGHKRDSFLVDTLGRFVTWVPVCPEAECGLGIPREAMRLVGDPAAPRLVTIHTALDHTERMLAWARRRVHELEGEDLAGFVFKSRSPSSGMERVKVYDERGNPTRLGVGLFAREFMRHFPLLPVEDEGRLQDPLLRENFIERVFTLARYRALPRTRRALVDFHADHKMVLMAHSVDGMRELGRIVATPDSCSPRELFARYEEALLKTLALLPTPKKHANCLQHMMGHLKTRLTADEKQELLGVIMSYKDEVLPLVVPVTLLQHYARKYDVAYLRRQAYLCPHPLELKLRNHA